MWPYQQERQKIYKFDWDRDNRNHLREYRQAYRKLNPEATRKQRLKDWRTFRDRNPERWREIHREANRRYQARRKALMMAMREALQKEVQND